MPDMRIDLPFPKPSDPDTVAQYYAYYGDDLHFNSTHAAFGLSKNVLEIKFLQQILLLIVSMRLNVLKK